MPQMFDPNLPDFEGQQAKLEQQRQMAQLLRKQAMATPQADGQMVGNRYVQSSWLEQLIPIMQQLNAGNAEDVANKTSADNSAAQEAHAQQWRSALPQAVAGRPALPGPQAEQGSPELNAVPDQPVTRDAILKYTLEGLRNPRLKDEAGLVNKSLTSELDQREAKDFKRQENAAAAVERAQVQQDRLEARKQELEMRLADSRLAAEDRAKLAAQHDATLRAIADNGNASREAIAEMNLAGKKDAAGREMRTNIEHLSRRAEPVVPMLNAAQQVQDMIDAHTDEKTGKVKDIKGIGFITGSLPGAVTSVQGSTNRQKVQMFANAMIRAQAGLSQTLSEAEKVELEMLRSGRFTQAQFTAAWPNLMSKVNSTHDAIQAGYEPNVVNTFNKRGGKFNPVKSKFSSNLTPAEQAELDALKAGK